jgi:ribosomal protein S11
MLKQKKNFYTKSSKKKGSFQGPGVDKKSNPVFRTFLRLKQLLRFKRTLKHGHTFIKSLGFLNLNYTQKIYIRVTSNNVFCTFVKQNKTIKVGSAGIFKVKTSLKKLRFSSKIILETFFKRVQKVITSNKLLINLIGPIKLKKKIIKILTSLKNAYIRHPDGTLILTTKAKKCFNGCRPKKKIRKKRRYIRIVK